MYNFSIRWRILFLPGCYTYTEKSSPSLVKSNQIWIVITKTESQLVLNQSDRDNYNPNLVWIVWANLKRVTSPTNLIPWWFPSYLLLSLLLHFNFIVHLHGARDRIFLLFLPWLPCHFYLVIENISPCVHKKNRILNPLCVYTNNVLPNVGECNFLRSYNPLKLTYASCVMVRNLILFISSSRPKSNFSKIEEKLL